MSYLIAIFPGQRRVGHVGKFSFEVCKLDKLAVASFFEFLSTPIPTSENSRVFSFQQAPVGGDFHLQVLLDTEELVVVGLGALHVQPELGEALLHLAQGGLQVLHLSRIFLTCLTQVTFQRCYLRTARTNMTYLPYLPPTWCFSLTL